MLTLLLLRHAKAEQHGGHDDFDRVLTERGRADALALGAHMAGLRILPDLSLVSTAARTRQTFDLFARGADAPLAAQFDDDLYNATEAQLRDVLKDMREDVKTLMLVGHNPGIMDLAGRLARDGDGAELARLRGRFPPGCLALIAFDRGGDWRDARASGGRLDLLLSSADIASRS